MDTTPSSLTAVFLFNHRFEKNIDKLERIYKDRFSTRKYIMPFASRNDNQVTRVYETSWNFSGHIAQAGPSITVPGTTHYVVIADDLILNPQLNEHNLLDKLGLAADAAYIKSLASVDTLRYKWWRAFGETLNLDSRASGFDFRQELPSAEEAQSRFEKLGVDFRLPRPKGIRDWRNALWVFPGAFGWSAMLRYRRHRTSYPLIFGYADFFIVPAAAWERFLHYCGVFAALNCFAEVAVPTALSLAADKVVTELPINEHFIRSRPRQPGPSLQGRELWGATAINGFVQPFDRSLDRLLHDFPKELLYVHPVKLSQFN
ncbi:hypothetical protein F1C10_11180 [Sphingomonas sp. NBWT7]|uniref:hypothetical protein n=1 Tax=Sphingomonas sp. NBWT7 TaxID=2596913 RepID=UPI001625C7B6|nr:hypothetical protein [Sphingomonas sp. NBWT7]QNE32451.1 hypothetical protein F1C10_11180 [Sphingomonas sp. NBWT7]